jgi:hypothetical protein
MWRELRKLSEHVNKEPRSFGSRSGGDEAAVRALRERSEFIPRPQGVEFR